MSKLEEMDREILMLREYEELSYAEIAKLLHLPLEYGAITACSVRGWRSRLFSQVMYANKHSCVRERRSDGVSGR